jgi:hypothetical protein
MSLDRVKQALLFWKKRSKKLLIIVGFGEVVATARRSESLFASFSSEKEDLVCLALVSAGGGRGRVVGNDQFCGVWNKDFGLGAGDDARGGAGVLVRVAEQIGGLEVRQGHPRRIDALRRGKAGGG